MFFDLESSLLSASGSVRDRLCSTFSVAVFSTETFTSLNDDFSGVPTLLSLGNADCCVADFSLNGSVLP